MFNIKYFRFNVKSSIYVVLSNIKDTFNKNWNKKGKRDKFADVKKLYCVWVRQNLTPLVIKKTLFWILRLRVFYKKALLENVIKLKRRHSRGSYLNLRLSLQLHCIEDTITRGVAKTPKNM